MGPDDFKKLLPPGLHMAGLEKIAKQLAKENPGLRELFEQEAHDKEFRDLVDGWFEDLEDQMEHDDSLKDEENQRDES